MARGFGVSETFIGLTIVAIGTSAPELVSAMVAALHKKRDIAVGNLLGSSVYNIVFILGVTAMVPPDGVSIDAPLIAIDIPVMLGAAIACVPVFLTGRRIHRLEGAAFIAAQSCTNSRRRRAKESYHRVACSTRATQSPLVVRDLMPYLHASKSEMLEQKCQESPGPRFDAKAGTRVVTDEFLIQPLGSRHREAFRTLIGRAVPEEQATAAFNDTLSQQDEDVSLCLVAETRVGTLLGIARAHGPVEIDEDAVLINSQIAVLDLLIANSEAVGDALLTQLAGSVDQIGCGQLMESFSTQTA